MNSKEIFAFGTTPKDPDLHTAHQLILDLRARERMLTQHRQSKPGRVVEVTIITRKVQK